MNNWCLALSHRELWKLFQPPGISLVLGKNYKKYNLNSPTYNCHEKNEFKIFIIVIFNCQSNNYPYNKMRSTARPTADIETRVPMQYLITSYFAASNWAFNEWISCRQDSKSYKLINKSRFFKNKYSNAIAILTLSSLLVRLEVSAFWLASSSRMRLHSDVINKI